MDTYAAGIDRLTVNHGSIRSGPCERYGISHPCRPYLPPRIRIGSSMVTIAVRPLPGR